MSDLESEEEVLTVQESNSGSDRSPRGLTYKSASREEYESYQRPWIGLLLNMSCFTLYSYAVYYQSFDPQALMFRNMLEIRLKPYGLWIYLSYHSLVLQAISFGLHIIAFFLPKYEKFRDILFTCLSCPVGCFVVCTFWTVWSTQGRDKVFPKYVDSLYPNWLNHVSHTIILPINIAQIYLIYHRFMKRGAYLTLAYIILYGLFSIFFRLRIGTYIYPFIDEMSFISVAIFFGTNIFCIFALYQTGFFMTGLFHLKRIRRLTE